MKYNIVQISSITSPMLAVRSLLERDKRPTERSHFEVIPCQLAALIEWDNGSQRTVEGMIAHEQDFCLAKEFPYFIGYAKDVGEAHKLVTDLTDLRWQQIIQFQR